MSEATSTNRAYAKRYRKTPQGAAACAWNRLTSRAGAKYNHGRCYASVEVRISRADFMAWAVPQYEAWFREHPDVTPSIDRIESSGHYEAGNLRLISRSKNCQRRRGARNIHAPQGTRWCGGCQAYLPLANFHVKAKTKANPHGYANECRPCTNTRRNALRLRRKAEAG